MVPAHDSSTPPAGTLPAPVAARDRLRDHCLRSAVRVSLDRFLSRDYPHLPEPMRQAAVIDAVNEIVAAVEANYGEGE